MSIPESATTSLTEGIFLTSDREITENRSIVSISDDRPDWHLEDRVLSTGAMHLLGSSLLAIFSTDELHMTKSPECRLVGCRDESDIGTIATITTKWSAFRNIFLTSPGDDPVSSLSSSQGELHFIDKHDCRF